MAQRVIVSFVDDLDGGEAERTFTFALDGAEYEIDLSTSNFEALQKSLQPFVDAGRRVRRGRGHDAAKPSRTGTQASRASHAREVRRWAAANGMDVTNHGRIPVGVQQAYDAAHLNP